VKWLLRRFDICGREQVRPATAQRKLATPHTPQSTAKVTERFRDAQGDLNWRNTDDYPRIVVITSLQVKDFAIDEEWVDEEVCWNKREKIEVFRNNETLSVSANLIKTFVEVKAQVRQKSSICVDVAVFTNHIPEVGKIHIIHQFITRKDSSRFFESSRSD
jgi:hypothetical protein